MKERKKEKGRERSEEEREVVDASGVVCGLSVLFHLDSVCPSENILITMRCEAWREMVSAEREIGRGDGCGY